MPIQTPDIEIGDAYHAAAFHQDIRAIRGYGWVSGGEATAGPGVAITIPDDTTMWIDGNEVDVSPGDNSANLLPNDRHPRWASIVVNTAGEVEAVHSEADRPLTVPGTDEELTGRQGARPSPPIVTDASEVLHSLVWIPANASSIDPDHIIDRRFDARVDAYNFNLEPYSDADAIAAIEAEDPLDLAGVLNVGGAATVGGALSVDGSGGVDSPEIEFKGSRTSLPTDYDRPVVYRTGNAGTNVHPRHGDLNIVARSSVDASIRFLTGSTTPLEAVEIDANQHVTVENGGLSVAGTIDENGDDVATQVWVQTNAVQNNTGNNIEIQKDGTDGQGILNFKTQ